jgi:hypothetical protein
MKRLRIFFIVALAHGMVACTSSPGIDIDFKKRSVNGINVATATIQDVKNKYGEPDSTISTATEYYYIKEGIIFNFDFASKIRYIYCVLNPEIESKWAEYTDAKKIKISVMPIRNKLIRKYSEKYLTGKLGQPNSKYVVNMEGLGHITELDFDQVSVLYKDDRPFSVFLH